MATKLTKPVIREISIEDINGCKGDVCVTMSSSGISFHKGKRKVSTIPWSKITKLITLPPNIPAKFTGNEIAWLLELSSSKTETIMQTPTTAPPDVVLKENLDVPE